MAILFRKGVRSFGIGGMVLGQGPGDRVNPYKQDKVYGTSAGYISNLINSRNPGTITSADNGYAYKIYPNEGFTGGFNSREEGGVYGGSPDDVMFSVTPGRSFAAGPSYKGENGVMQEGTYEPKPGAQKYDVTVGQYQANPDAFKRMAATHDFSQYDNYFK